MLLFEDSRQDQEPYNQQGLKKVQNFSFSEQFLEFPKALINRFN